MSVWNSVNSHGPDRALEDRKAEIARLQEQIVRLTEHHDSMQAQMDWVRKSRERA